MKEKKVKSVTMLERLVSILTWCARISIWKTQQVLGLLVHNLEDYILVYITQNSKYRKCKKQFLHQNY